MSDFTAEDAARIAAFQRIACAPQWPWSCEWATRVIMCESSGDPNNIGTEVTPSGTVLHFYGWWQVLNGPLDPYLNTVEANIQFQEWQRGERTVSPWPSCGPMYP